MSRGRPRDEAARKRILDAVRRLICAHGPDRVSINDIAAAAGVGKQTIYRWWPSKSAVVIDALTALTEARMPFPETGSVLDDIREQMHRVAEVFASPTGSLIRHLVATSQGDHDVAELFRERFFNHRRALAAVCIHKGIESGELRRDLDLEAVVDALYAPLWLRLIMDHQPLTTAAADGILELVWPGIIATEKERLSDDEKGP